MIRPLACLYKSPLVSTIVQFFEKNCNTHSTFSSYIMEIQYSTEGNIIWNRVPGRKSSANQYS